MNTRILRSTLLAGAACALATAAHATCTPGPMYNSCMAEERAQQAQERAEQMERQREAQERAQEQQRQQQERMQEQQRQQQERQQQEQQRQQQMQEQQRQQQERMQQQQQQQQRQQQQRQQQSQEQQRQQQRQQPVQDEKRAQSQTRSFGASSAPTPQRPAERTFGGGASTANGGTPERRFGQSGPSQGQERQFGQSGGSQTPERHFGQAATPQSPPRRAAGQETAPRSGALPERQFGTATKGVQAPSSGGRTSGQAAAVAPAAPHGPERRPGAGTVAEGPAGQHSGGERPGGQHPGSAPTAANGRTGHEGLAPQTGRGGRPAAPTSYVYHGHTFTRHEAPAYKWPRGVSHESVAVGAVLPQAFMHAAYVIGRYAVYGLDAPPPGYEWVRYGPDAVEVDTATGQIAQEVNDVFYADDAGQDAADVGYGPSPDGPQGYADGQPDQYANSSDEMSAGVRALDDGDPERAVRLLGPALESGKLSGSNQELAYVKRAEANAHLRNYRRATADLERATALDPNDRQAQELLDEMRRNEGPNYWPMVLAALGAALIGGGGVFAGMHFGARNRRPAPMATATVAKEAAE